MNRSKLVPALFGHILLIIVPIVLMIIQGIQSLQDKKEDLVHSSRAELVGQDEHLRYHLQKEWDSFLDGEVSRPAKDYFPYSFPMNELFWTQEDTLAYQRSPLWNELSRLERHDESVDRRSLSLFQVSRLGYFEYDPGEEALSTPHDPISFFKDTSGPYSAFRGFLESNVVPQLNQLLDLNAFESSDPLSLLLRLKTHRIYKSNEPLNQYVQAFKPQDSFTRDTIEIGYYGFQFHSFTNASRHYLIGYRAVLIENQQIRLQGFVLDLFGLLQEIQAYLEPLQPDFGQVVIGFGLDGAEPLFKPFDMLGSNIVIHQQSKALETFKKDRNRFWQVMITLIVILMVTSFALAKMIVTETQLNQKKTDFISAVTHELRTPLTSIQMYAEMLEEGWVRGKEQVYYHHISSESKRLNRMISNVLNFARLEKGSFVLNMQRVEFGSFISETLDAWETWLDESKLKVSWDCDDETWIYVDPDALKQVFYNLCDNAIKYARQDGEAQLFIECETIEDEVLIRVFDNGPGVPKRERPHIFQRFYRIENESTRETTGTGLGLAIVREMVQECGGRVTPFMPEKTSGFGLIFYFPTLESAGQGFE